MIHRIYSSLNSFKTFDLQPGFNLIVADRAEQSGLRETRNKAGKSSLVQVIHFLFGGEGKPDSIFRTAALAAHTFSMDVDIGGTRLTVSRSGQEFKNVSIEIPDGNLTQWPVDPLSGKRSGVVTTTKWREALGRAIFDLPENPGTYGPKFGSLFNYFARRDKSGGFLEPTRQNSRQSPADIRVALSYLIGLDWTISQQREVLRQELVALAKMGKSEHLKAFVGDQKALGTTAVLARRDIERLTQALDSFEVLDDYQVREIEANALTQEINSLTEENYLDCVYAEELRASLSVEKPPSVDDLKRLYDEVGVSLPDVSIRRYQQAQDFHKSVVSNRKAYVEEELEAIANRTRMRAERLERLDSERASIMSILKTHGALDQYTKLSEDLAAARASEQKATQRLELLSAATTKKAELGIKQQELVIRLGRDLKANSSATSSAILAFETASEGLYTDPGKLSISATDAGPDFDIQMQGDESRGVRSAQIFCFDVMLMTLTQSRDISPGFLFHDSQLFDSVDGRQVFQAWAHGEQLCREIGFQYIVTINSDQIPQQVDRSDGFLPEDYILEPRLTDEHDGGLFGIRFG